ncbi:MAG: hypothetical protein M0R80_16305 [Proteobacteria bacterium]|jgi:hypothetical protein|nr:hypothetical protein [Pseudomonadota bacterium]
MTSKTASCAFIAACLAAQSSALAETEPSEAAAEAPAEDSADEGAGINLDLGFATHYVFRGLNLFQESAQLDPHTLLAPGVTWSVADTGLSLGWWAAFQLNGPNLRDNIDAGVGAEQDLFATYEFGLTDTVALGLQLYAYLYPFADEDVTLTRGAPIWLEPGASITWSTAVDLGLTVTYMAGVQDAIAEYSYLYLSPSVGRSFVLDEAETLSLDLGASFGYKAWLRADEKMQDNTFDVGVKAGLTWYATGVFYLTPAVGFAWTNLEGLGFADQLIVYGMLNVGVDL